MQMLPIIIINWNGLQDTNECIDSILRSEYKEFRVILVDNGSDHDEGSRLAEKWKDESRIEVRLLPENIGFTRANNIVLKEILDSTHQQVVLLNNDTVIDPLCLGNLLETFKRTDAGMVSSKFLNYYQPELIDNLGHQMLNTGEVVPIAHGESAGNYRETFENFGSCAGGALYSVEMLRDIGIFDEFFSTGYEDAELGVRATILGYESVYAPGAIIYHKMGQSIKKVFNREYALMIQTAIWYTYFKLMPGWVLIISLPFICFKMVALTLINLLFLRFSYLSIQWRAIFNVLVRHRKKIIEKRNSFFKEYKTIPAIDILKRQQFFLIFDLKRFYRIFIKGKRSAIDQYGSE